MDNSTITLLIRYFNILSATVMAFFAVYGAIAVFGKKSSLNIFRRNIFIQAFCVAALFAFVLEATVSNFSHYLKYFADDECHTLEVSPLDSTIILTSDGTVAEKFFKKKDSTAVQGSTHTQKYKGTSVDASSKKDDGVAIRDSARISASGGILTKASSKEKGDSTTILGGVVFKDLNRRVTSIFVAPVFDSSENIVMNISYIDAWGTEYRSVLLHKGLPHTHYVTLQPLGNVSELRVAFPDIRPGAAPIPVSQIAINKRIPYYFSGLRLIAVSLLFFAIIFFAYKPFRAKAVYFLFEYRFDPADKKQNLIYAFSVALLILFSGICAYTSVIEDEIQARQYNEYLVDAIIAGRTHLEAGNPEKMLKAERPYDLRWLDENKYERDKDWFGDWVYYKGKFYCYFGVVPALLLYVPYKMITGDYLSNHGGIFLFAAMSIILLARLWRFFVKKYMPDARFVFYLLSFLTLFFASGWFCPLRFTRFYSIVSAAGFMFVIAGVLLLFESVERDEKPDRSKLFFAAACFALAVGCRPNLLFASLIVPVILWKYKLWKHLPLIAIPYIAAAIPMCAYNYIRFGSILDFGIDYNMTNLNLTAYGLLNPIGKTINVFIAFLAYLFTVNTYSFYFPYVECYPHDMPFWAITLFYDKGCGMLNFPIVLCLLFFFKSIIAKGMRPKTFYISSTFLAIAAVLIFIDSYLVGHSGRYTIDFAVFIILPSLFCAYYWCNGVGDGGGSLETSGNQFRARQKVTYILLVVSIFVGLFLFATSVTNDATPYNPNLYRYLQQSLILLGIV